MYGFENKPSENIDFVIERQFNKYTLWQTINTETATPLACASVAP